MLDLKTVQGFVGFFFVPYKNHKQSETKRCEFYLANELSKSLNLCEL